MHLQIVHYGFHQGACESCMKKGQDSQAILGLVTITVVVAAILYFGYLDNQPQTDIKSDSMSSLVIDYGNGTKRQFEGPVKTNMTVLEALLASKNGGALDTKYSLAENGALVLSAINGQVGDARNKSWNFYLNGQLIDRTTISSTRISPGDLIEVRYE